MTMAMSAPQAEGDADGDGAILDAIERFVERSILPVAHDLEARDEYPHGIVEEMKDLGLFGATIAPEYGGLGLSAVTYSAIIERITAGWMSISGIINSHLIMAAAVQRFGTEQQKARFLPKFATGELRGGIALTEPDCGTDLQAVRTRAERQGNAYIVNGTKTWITNSVEGDILAVLVKTDPAAEPRHRGMSLLLVEQGEGVATSKLNKLGYRGVDTGEVVLDRCQVPFDNLVGGEEGRGCSRFSPVSNSAASTWRPAASASPGSAWKRPSNTPSCARPSASPSPSIRRSRSSSPTWRPGWRPRAC